jgi:hypothetical protein
LVEGLQVVLPDGGDVGDQQVEPTRSQSGDHQLADEHDHSSHAAHHRIPQGVGPCQLKSVLGGIAEVLAPDGDLDVGLGVDELDDAFHTGQEALQASDDILEALVGLSLGLGLALDHFHHHLQELDDSEEEGTEG